MKFKLTYASDFVFEKPEYVEINTIEDIVALDKRTGKYGLVFYSPSSEDENEREIMVYDSYIE